MEQTADALNELLDSAIAGETLDDGSADTQLKVLHLIVQRGIEEQCKPRDSTLSQWIVKCLAGVEAICDRTPLLLNRPVKEGGQAMYKWILTTLIQLLSTHDDAPVVEAVKGALITVIHLISTKLRLFTYKRDIRGYFLSTFDAYLAAIFKPTTPDKLLGLLSICCNLFSLLTDLEVKRKMLIDQSFDQRFETASRRIDYILTNMDQHHDRHRIELIKAHMVINVLNYCINEDHTSTTRLSFALTLYRDSLQHPNITLQPLVRTNIALALLKLFKVCLTTEYVSSFVSCLQFDSIRETVDRIPADQTLSKVVSFIAFALDPQDPQRNTQNVQTPFTDPILESLRQEILEFIQADGAQVRCLSYRPDPETTTLEQWVRSVKPKRDTLTSHQRYSIITSLGDFVCMLSGHYDVSQHMCSTCSTPEPVDQQRPDLEKSQDVKLAFALLMKYSSQGDSILDMATLIALHKFFTHFQPPKVISTCPAFNFVKASLTSTNRDVRLLAVRIIPLYIRSRHNIYDTNTTAIIMLANSLDLDDQPHLAESTIMIWGQLAISTDGTGLHPILLKLVDFLASSSSFRSSMAFHELEVTAIARGQTPWKLLSLVLPSLSLTIAQKLSTKPVMAQRISDLVGVPIQTILMRYQADTVPYLLTYYKRDLIAEIAQASGKPKLEIVLGNRAKIFAFLLTSLPDPSEAKIHGILANACPEISKINLEDVCSPPLPTIWELLKLHGLEGKSDELIKKSILFVLRLGRPGVSERELFTTFLQKNTLGVVNLFSDAIRDTKGIQTYDQKMRSFRGIELLVQISSEYGTFIVSALPQIYTCLQSSLEVSLLREATLRCWRILCQHLEEAHLVSLLDQTIATVVQKWDTFDHRCKVEAKKLIAVFFDKSEPFRAKHIYTFYSLAGHDDLAEMYTKVFNVMMKTDKPGSLLSDITRRCKHDNKYVVKQALVDLDRFLKKYETDFYTNFLTRPLYVPLVATLIGGLMDILNKFKSVDDVCIQCSKCLGKIGALDPAKFEVERRRDQIVVASNFEEQREKVKFLLLFLNQHLVPAFWASEDPTKQVFLAYVMQELLKFCGLDHTRFDLSNPDPNSQEYALWCQFSDISKSTLTPLVSSKYTASVSQYVKLYYPIFSITLDHDKWIRQLTMDLLKRGVHQNVREIFTACSSLTKEQDISLCSFLLPYAALNTVVMEDNDEELANMKAEIMTVLSTDINEVHHLAVQSLKLAYETVFGLLDYFRKWVFSRKQLLKRRNVKHQDPGIKKVMSLLDGIPQQLMAKRSFQANSYERAALYLEQCHRSGDVNTFGDTFYGTLQSMYASIGDYDALDGVLKKFSTKSLDDRITELEYSDNWKMAQDCLEALGDVDTIDSDTRLLKSLFDHNLYDQTLEKLENIVTVNTPLKKEWLNIGLEASVLNGKKEFLEKWISQLDANRDLADGANLVYYHMGKALLAEDETTLRSAIENAYLTLGVNLGLNKPASLKKNRSQMVLLHSISDLEAILTRSGAFEGLKQLMDLRMSHAGNDFKSSWVLESMRRSCQSFLGKDANIADISETWLASSKSARKHNRVDLATSSIMHAIQLGNKNTELEYAKLLWAQGDHTRALAFIEEMRSSTNHVTIREKAAIQLKYTKWLDYSNNSSSTKIIEEYNAAIKIDSSWEKPYYALGRYYNKLLDIKSKPGLEKIDAKDVCGELERRIINYYLKAIMCGTKYLFEALPKVITVWLDFAENVDNLNLQISDSVMSTVLAERKKNLNIILEDIAKSLEKVPVYYWYTVFSQLLSRLLHPHRNTGQQIIVIAQKVVNEFPAHSLWSVLAQYKSTQKEREKKARRILELFSSTVNPNSETEPKL